MTNTVKRQEDKKLKGGISSVILEGAMLLCPQHALSHMALLGIKGDHYTEGLLTDYRLANNPLLYVS